MWIRRSRLAQFRLGGLANRVGVKFSERDPFNVIRIDGRREYLSYIGQLSVVVDILTNTCLRNEHDYTRASNAKESISEMIKRYRNDAFLAWGP